MVDYRVLEGRLSEVLGLQRRAVAIAFRDAAPADVSKFTGTQPSGCSFWRIAAEGRTFYTIPSDHYNCPIGSYTHNLALPQDRTQELTQTLERLSLSLYQFAAERALQSGLILADAKFEFGFDGGDVILIDELLTPDSSRFWDAAHYRPGGPQPSFDKQYVRDYLEQVGWNKQAPAPALPDEVVDGTSRRYLEALRRLTGPAGPREPRGVRSERLRRHVPS